jgi:hypothetical protein
MAQIFAPDSHSCCSINRQLLFAVTASTAAPCATKTRTHKFCICRADDVLYYRSDTVMAVQCDSHNSQKEFKQPLVQGPSTTTHTHP